MNVVDVITAYLMEETLEQPEILTPTTHLVEEGILDSLGMINLVTFLEERFDLEIEPDELTYDNFTTIANIEALVSKKQDGGASAR